MRVGNLSAEAEICSAVSCSCIRMETKAGNKQQTLVELGLASAVVNNAVRFVRCAIDNTTHGILRVLNLGCKKSVPKVNNELLLQPAVQLAGKIRRGEVSLD